MRYLLLQIRDDIASYGTSQNPKVSAFISDKAERQFADKNDDLTKMLETSRSPKVTREDYMEDAFNKTHHNLMFVYKSLENLNKNVQTHMDKLFTATQNEKREFLSYFVQFVNSTEDILRRKPREGDMAEMLNMLNESKEISRNLKTDILQIQIVANSILEINVDQKQDSAQTIKRVTDAIEVIVNTTKLEAQQIRSDVNRSTNTSKAIEERQQLMESVLAEIAHAIAVNSKEISKYKADTVLSFDVLNSTTQAIVNDCRRDIETHMRNFFVQARKIAEDGQNSQQHRLDNLTNLTHTMIEYQQYATMLDPFQNLSSKLDDIFHMHDFNAKNIKTSITDLQNITIQRTRNQKQMILDAIEGVADNLNMSTERIKSHVINLKYGVMAAITRMERNVSAEVQVCSNCARSSCQPSTIVRLAGGTGSDRGRVEVYHDGSWGTVCDDDWDINDAHVVCRMLCFSSATSAPAQATYGEGSGPVWMDQVRCVGTESTIINCGRNNWGEEDCSHSEDASVVCQH